MAFRTRHKVYNGKDVYVIRNAKGQITDVQNIGRAINQDSKINAKTKVIGVGHGFMGDYKVKRASKRKTPQSSGVFGTQPKIRIGLF